MTVGIAAKAEGGQAIVVVLDKQRTNDLSGLRIDDVDAKGFRLDNGWLLFYAQDGTFARSVWVEANRQLPGLPTAPADADDVRAWIVRAYAKVYGDHADVLFSEYHYDWDKYVARDYPLDVLLKIDALVTEFDQGGTADLLVCGFDAAGDGQIIKVVPKSTGEIALTTAAIGIGADVAEQHLAYHKVAVGDRLPQTVYRAVEAKVHSENAYIGEPTDAFILFRTGTVHLSPDTKGKLRAVMARYDRVPIDALAKALAFHESKPEQRAQAEPAPEEWARELVEHKLGAVLKQITYARTLGRRTVWGPRVKVVGEDVDSASTPSSLPIETAPPSSQSPNDGRH